MSLRTALAVSAFALASASCLYVTSVTAGTTTRWQFEPNIAGDSLGFAVAAVGDLNQDGFADIAVSSNSGVSVFFGSAGGPFVSAPWIETSYGTLASAGGDIDGDGIQDLLTYDRSTISSGGRINLFVGQSTGPGSVPSSTIVGPADASGWGNQVVGVGDIYGEGHDDVLVSAPHFGGGSDNGQVVLYRGSSSGLSSTPVWTFSGGSQLARVGEEICSAGDMNGDGYADVAILCGIPFSANRSLDSTEVILFFAGSPSGLPATPTWQVTRLTYHIAGPGDFNGDGYSDIVASALEDNAATTTVIGGSSGGPVSLYSCSGTYARIAGDVNGDGYADVLTFHSHVECPCGNPLCLPIGCGPGGSAIELNLGGPSGFTAGGGESTPWNSAVFVGAGDIDGKGFSELVYGLATYSNGQLNEGAVRVDGWSSPVSPHSDANLFGSAGGDGMGTCVAGIGDLNGDGIADVAVGSPGFTKTFPGEGRVSVYLGTPDGLPTTPSFNVYGGATNAHLGSAIAGGDLNGDGYSDLIMGIPEFSGIETNIGEGAIRVLYGHATPDSIPDLTIESGQAGAHFGASVDIAGDVNGDGILDLVVGAPNYTNLKSSEGRAFLFLGRTAGLATTPSWTVDGGSANANLGSAVAGVGDVNGDSFSDVVVGAPGLNQVQVFDGSGSGLPSSPSATLSGTGGFGASLASAGDVNGDGYADLIVGAPNFISETQSGEVQGFLGSNSGLSTTASWTIYGSSNDHLGFAVAGGGDVDGDGYSDVVVGRPGSGSTDGGADIYLGSSTGLPAAASMTSGGFGSSSYGSSLAMTDFNADGFSDVIVGDPTWSNLGPNQGAATLLSGEAPGRARMIRQLRPDRATPMDLLSGSGATGFTIGGRAFAALGRARVRLEWQVRTLGGSWSAIQRGPWTDSGSPHSMTGSAASLLQLVQGLAPSTPYAWRARVTSPTSPLFPHSPWFDMRASAPGLTEMRTGTAVLAVSPSRSTSEPRLIRDVQPNPVASSAVVQLSIARAGEVEALLMDVRGRQVRSLFRGSLAAGPHQIIWNARDRAELAIPPGVYFVRVRSGNTVDARRVVLLR